MNIRLWTEPELETFTKRYLTFVKEGLDGDEASDLAEKMLVRDFEGWDDRRVCFECKKYDSKNGTCPKIVDGKGRPQKPLRFILQRCEWFELKGKK